MSSRRRCLAVVLLFCSTAVSAATFTVTNTNDFGPGSLRQAIIDANVAAPATVAFNIPTASKRIGLLSPLDGIGLNTIVDGTTQPGYSGHPVVELDFSAVFAISESAPCVQTAGSVKGLAIGNCRGRAVAVSGGTFSLNWVGVDASGTEARTNSIGVFAVNTYGNLSITNNVIASSRIYGLVITGNGNFPITGNLIGLDPTGERAKANATGVYFTQASSITLGGNAPADRNYICGNGNGIALNASDNITIAGNSIGVTPQGALIGNTTGILFSRSNLCRIGTPGVLAPNVIAGNTVGVEVDQFGSIRNVIRGNSIYSNSFLGIDLDGASLPIGPTMNDPGDADTGGNNLQNFPTGLRGGVHGDGSVTVTGALNSAASQQYTIDLYANTSCSPSGYGEGKTYLKSFDVTTDASGSVPFLTQLSSPLPVGTVLTATATDSFGNTSEFSPCGLIEGPGAFGFTTGFTSVSEAAGSLALRVLRTGGSFGAVSVSYATASGTATAGADFTSTSGTLTFADGQTEATINIPILQDVLYDPAESFTVTLSNPTGGATLTSPSTINVTINDDDPAPVLTIAGTTVPEGNTPSGVSLPFTVTLTSASGQPVSVDYRTVDNYPYSGYATAGVDYQPVSGTLTFAPGETKKTIVVPIIGDTKYEPDETVYVSLTNVVGAANYTYQAAGVIQNDDPRPTITVADVRIVEGNAGRQNAIVTLTASEQIDGYQYVSYFTNDGTAKSGSDYIYTSGGLYFGTQSPAPQPPQTTQTIAIPILGDTNVEPDETFTLVFSTSGPYALTKTSITITIENDDAGVSPAPLTVAPGSTANIAVNLGTATGNQTMTVSSSNPAIASVPATFVISGTGNIPVTGNAVGHATITVTTPPSMGSVSTRVEVDVFEPAHLVLTPDTLRLPIGGNVTVTARFQPPLATAETVAITVTGTGKVTVPSTISIPAGASSTTFTIGGVESGHLLVLATLSATHGSAITSADVTVVDATTLPSLASVSPSNGPIAGGTAVTLSGSNLRNDCTVRFGGVAATNVAFVSATSITATTPAHTSGPVDVALSCGSDTSTLANAFTYLGVSPHLSGVTPSFGSSAGGTLVSVAGDNFISGCWPFFDGVAARSANVIDAARIVASTPPHAAATDVTVTLRCNGSVPATLANAFSYTSAAEPSPVITGVNPLSGAVGRTVTVSGARFRDTDIVTFDGVRATTLSTDFETHVVRIPEVSAGKVSVTVTDIGGHASTTGPIFTVLDAQQPQITSATPRSVRPLNEVVLDGSGFRPGYSFMVGDQTASVLELSYSRVTLRVPALAAGTYDLRVVDAASNVAASGPPLTILAGALDVERVSPLCTTNAGGMLMTLTGNGFAAGATVTIGGVVASGVTIVDAHTLTFPLPANVATGWPTVVVKNTNGDTASLTRGFMTASPFDPNGCPRSRASHR